MTSHNQKNIPWVEKYRPTHFDNIVLDDYNRKLFGNILEKKYFPNLLFYGPPGTGKTTTIINLINQYQYKYHKNAKGSVIHLNASDERGIDIIRNQINQFVRSSNLFETGFKFVILDEVDYMTKNAQQALKYLLQTSTYNVRFCLICNYISKIEESLQHEFICIRFNQLPKKDIHQFIKHMTEKENIQISDISIETIQHLYHSDIRSMINYIQLNQNNTDWEENIIHSTLWKQLDDFIREAEEEELIQYLHDTSIQYNIDKKQMLQHYFNYVIREKKENNEFLNAFLEIAKRILHCNETHMEYIIRYFVTSMKGISSIR